MGRITVRQEKPRAFSPTCYEVVKDKKVVAIIAPRKTGGWYWYGTGGNTYAVEKTFEQCKEEAVKSVKEMGEKK